MTRMRCNCINGDVMMTTLCASTKMGWGRVGGGSTAPPAGLTVGDVRPCQLRWSPATAVASS
jgi:hypothetical protein